jgi:glycine/D-amino acid oxidase-like deaminating enzyme
MLAVFMAHISSLVQIVDRVPIRSDRDLGPALVFPNQGQFHPVKYYDGLAKAVTRLGGKIFTRTHASDMKGGSAATVTTKDGRIVQCNQIIVATSIVRIFTREIFRF